MINSREVFRTWLLVLVIVLFAGCRAELSYPEVIVKNGLEDIYDKGFVDWHILNSTGVFSHSKYLLVYDSLVDSRIYKRDSLERFWVLDHDLVSDKETMERLFPDNIIHYLSADLELYSREGSWLVHGDTVKLTFFPRLVENTNALLEDPIDGYIHTIYYVDQEIIRVGQNDYIEFDLDEANVRLEEQKLLRLVDSLQEIQINPRLRRLLEQKE